MGCTKPSTMVSDIKEVGTLAGNEAKETGIANYYAEVMDKVSSTASIPSRITRSESSETTSPTVRGPAPQRSPC